MTKPEISKSELRVKLTALGEQRESILEELTAMTEEIQTTVAAAKGKIPSIEVAKLLRMNRSTLYRVYK